MTHPIVLGIVVLYLIGMLGLGADPVLAGLAAGGLLYLAGSLLRPDPPQRPVNGSGRRPG